MPNASSIVSRQTDGTLACREQSLDGDSGRLGEPEPPRVRKVRLCCNGFGCLAAKSLCFRAQQAFAASGLGSPLA